jgi:hypothetical protein
MVDGDVTPLQFTRSIAKPLEDSMLPQPTSAQVGEIIIPCAGTYVTILNQTEIDQGRNCDAIPVGDVVITSAFDCANVANDDGTTNWDAQDVVSAQLDLAGDYLWGYIADIRADVVYRSNPPVLSYLQTGGLAMATITAQLPIP